MNFVLCRSTNGKLVYSMVELEARREDLLQHRFVNGPSLLCVHEALPAELLRDAAQGSFPSKEGEGHRTVIEFLGRADMLILEMQYRDTLPRNPPARLINTISKILEAGTSDCVVLIVPARQFAWMYQQAAGQNPAQVHGAPAQDTCEPRAMALPSSARSQAHPHAERFRVRNVGEPADLRAFTFRGFKHGYISRSRQHWGSLYVDNPDRSRRQRLLHQDLCPFCGFADRRMLDRPTTEFVFEGARYVITPNELPIVDPQYIIIPVEDADGQPDGLRHRIDINGRDIRLMMKLAESGMQGIEVLTAIIDELAPAFDGSPLASYVNAFPGSGRTQEHLHLQCVVAASIPLPEWQPAAWQIAFSGRSGTSIERAQGSSFYALMWNGTDTGISESMVRLHARMNQIDIPYNLIVYPCPDATGVKKRCVLVPRKQEYAALVGQKIAGLEFLSGVLIPDPSLLPLDTGKRDQAFRSVTLDGPAILAFERELRALFGLPSLGRAVYANSENGQRQVIVGANRLAATPFLSQALCERLWKRRWTRPGIAPNVHVEDTDAADPVMVRLTHAAVTGSDRSQLLPRNTSLAGETTPLGMEGGGIIVDPGNATDLHAGQKAAIIPLLPCGACDACASRCFHLCENPSLSGLDRQGSLAQLVIQPRAALFPVSDSFPDAALPLIMPLARAMHLLARLYHRLEAPAAPLPGVNPLVIFGAGILGCMTALAVRRLYPNLAVLLIEPQPLRRAAAADMLDTNERGEGGQFAHVAENVPEHDRHRIAIVTTTSYRTYYDAFRNCTHYGIVVAASQAQADAAVAPATLFMPSAAEIHALHLAERSETRTIDRARTATIIGARGFDMHDARRAVHELEHYFSGHYGRIQNVLIRGLDARSALTTRNRGAYPANDVPAVVSYLAAAGMRSPGNGDRIARALSILVII